ncbi:MAG: CfrBI family restriction endonuclease [Oligoflexia bacterium]|nr:CfrBI family restriction endonuclease [Oligoflexia bacterium]
MDLNINESLLVINALAVKRSALRGGSWSSLGKRVEEPLMKTLCKLYKVPAKNYKAQIKNNDEREIDFWLINNKNYYKCEVKLMGKGNPESADAGLARGSHIFIADKLSEKFKKEFDRLRVHWVELNSKKRFLQFENVLKNLKIPYKTPSLVTEAVLENILKIVS